MWRQRRAMAAGLALTAAALAAAGLGGGEAPGGAEGAAGAGPVKRRPVPLVSAPVRIADAATVRLLRPGDQVDVIAAEGAGADARVVAKGARVAAVPRAPADGWAEDPAERPATSGALVVLSVPRSTAASLAGAGISARLAVTLC
jgi:hypothetical protein